MLDYVVYSLVGCETLVCGALLIERRQNPNKRTLVHREEKKHVLSDTISAKDSLVEPRSSVDTHYFRGSWQLCHRIESSSSDASPSPQNLRISPRDAVLDQRRMGLALPKICRLGSLIQGFHRQQPFLGQSIAGHWSLEQKVRFG